MLLFFYFSAFRQKNRKIYENTDYEYKTISTGRKRTRTWVAGKDMAHLECIENAYLLVEDQKIAAFGKMETLNKEAIEKGTDFLKEVDATGRLVLPSFCDSHTHLVYAGSREIEYIDKIRGLSYEEIARRGGGILNSAERMRKASEEELFDSALARIEGDCCIRNPVL